MQPPTLALIALLAPLPAAAFGDLDCITVEYCANSDCGPETTPFAVTFDWVGDAAIVSFDNTDLTLPWASTDENGTDSVLVYGDMNDINHQLLIQASGADITAYYSFHKPVVTTWRAVCDVRTAA